ncbi:MAG: hypothetical protein JNM17_34435 [Archangium sp.]|nr:hypothetical protein [Archangium sp.]
MTPALAVLVLVAAPPAPAPVPVAGAKHTLTITDSRELSGTVEGRKAAMDTLPQVGKATIAFTIGSVDGARPSQLELSVTSGNEGLKGRAFTAEVLSGDLLLRDTRGAPKGAQLEATKTFKPFVGALLREDPIVAAARSGADGCSSEVREKVLDATAHEVHALIGGTIAFELAPGGEASCGKKKTPEKYDVKFGLTLRSGEYTVVFPFKGTVEIGAKAWHANLDLSASTKFDMPGYGVKGKMSASITLKTTVK